MNRLDPARVDTAISSHYYDATNHEMDFVVQNRGAFPITGLTLNLTMTAGAGATGDSTTTRTLPPLAAGAIYVAKISVDDRTLAAGSMKFTTQLVNPNGLTDAVPANNRKSSTLVPPTPTK